MNALEAFGLWTWIEENGAAFEPPVGNKVIWEDSQFTAMVIRGPNARRDFHIDPSDEIFFMLKGAMTLETLEDGPLRRLSVLHRRYVWDYKPVDTQTRFEQRAGEPFVRIRIDFDNPCDDQRVRVHVALREPADRSFHEVTMHVADIQKGLKRAIEDFDARVDLRTCARCGHVQPERAPIPLRP